MNVRETNKIFHLAIPTKDIESAEDFYVKKLGARLARKYDDRITLDFFGDQVVCHLSPDLDYSQKPKMYPRHFGITFFSEEEFNKVYKLAKEKQILFFKDKFTRFKDKREEHYTFLLQDPSNNLLEFKFYKDQTMAY